MTRSPCTLEYTTYEMTVWINLFPTPTTPNGMLSTFSIHGDEGSHICSKFPTTPQHCVQHEHVNDAAGIKQSEVNTSNDDMAASHRNPNDPVKSLRSTVKEAVSERDGIQKHARMLVKKA
jgi:hypothetical protein